MDVLDYVFGPQSSVMIDGEIELVKSLIDLDRTNLVGGFYYNANLKNLYAGRPSYFSIVRTMCASLRLKIEVQHPRPAGRRMLRWTDEASTSAARNVA